MEEPNHPLDSDTMGRFYASEFARPDFIQVPQGADPVRELDYLTAKFRALGNAELRMGLAGLWGCTSLVLVSTKGVYVSTSTFSSAFKLVPNL